MLLLAMNNEDGIKKWNNRDEGMLILYPTIEKEGLRFWEIAFEECCFSE